MKLLKDTFNDFNRLSNIDMEDYGSLRDKINDNIYIYDPKRKIFSTIIAHVSLGELNKISFAGNELKLSLDAFTSTFGKFRYAYNFRDNYTQSFFESIACSNKVRCVTAKKDNNVVLDKNLFFYETDPKGNIQVFKSNELIFNNFTLELYSSNLVHKE
jgi:hypothetical protein